MEPWSTHQLYRLASTSVGTDGAVKLRLYAQQLMSKGCAVVFTLGHLAKITDASYRMLQATVNRKRESVNYRMYAVAKRSGGRRFIHSVCEELFRVQQFINQEILQMCRPHSSSFAFHPSGGIRECAAMHCGAKWLFQFDLTDFFYDVTETDVYEIFKDIGYRPLLAFELARICTTIRLPNFIRTRLLYHQGGRDYPEDFDESVSAFPYCDRSGAIGVLPQGAPTSPMLSNLAARNLDESLQQYSLEKGFVYTRYADDITISASTLTTTSLIGNIQRDIIHRIRRSGFKENIKKTRIAGPGSKKVVLGLLVDGSEPRLTRQTYRRIDRNLHAANKYGFADVALHEGFDSAYGFINHLSGLISYVKDVDLKRWQEFLERFKRIPKIIT